MNRLCKFVFSSFILFSLVVTPALAMEKKPAFVKKKKKRRRKRPSTHHKTNSNENLVNIAKVNNLNRLKELLQQASVSIEYIDQSGKTAFEYALLNKHPDAPAFVDLFLQQRGIIKILNHAFSTINLDKINSTSKNLLGDFYAFCMIAVKKLLTSQPENEKYISNLKKLFPDIEEDIENCSSELAKREDNLYQKEELPLLHCMVKRGYYDIADIMIHTYMWSLNDTSINYKTGQTPLHIAAMINHAPIANLLIRHRAKPNQQDKHGDTTLHTAARYASLEVVKTILNNHSYKHIPIKNRANKLAQHIAAERVAFTWKPDTPDNPEYNTAKKILDLLLNASKRRTAPQGGTGAQQPKRTYRPRRHSRQPHNTTPFPKPTR